MLIQEDLGRWPVPLREALGAGEPLNPEVIEQVRARLGHHGARRLRPDRDDRADRQHAGPAGQARLDGPPAARLRGRAARPDQRRAGRRGGDRARPRAAPARADDRLPRRRRAQRRPPRRGGYYRTGDVAPRDDDGYITYVGRTDDVFKASDYRISPFELESVLIEHEAVAEAAVVPVARPDAPRRAQGVRDARAPGTSRRARPRSTSCASRASTSRPTSASAGSSSASCRRRSRARSAASSCATTSTRARHARRRGRVLGGGLPGAKARVSQAADHPGSVPRAASYAPPRPGRRGPAECHHGRTTCADLRPGWQAWRWSLLLPRSSRRRARRHRTARSRSAASRRPTTFRIRSRRSGASCARPRSRRSSTAI